MLREPFSVANSIGSHGEGVGGGRSGSFGSVVGAGAGGVVFLKSSPPMLPMVCPTFTGPPPEGGGNESLVIPTVRVLMALRRRSTGGKKSSSDTPKQTAQIRSGRVFNPPWLPEGCVVGVAAGAAGAGEPPAGKFVPHFDHLIFWP
jgi:hypothetical protein